MFKKRDSIHFRVQGDMLTRINSYVEGTGFDARAWVMAAIRRAMAEEDDARARMSVTRTDKRVAA